MLQNERERQSIFNSARDSLAGLWRDGMRRVAKKNASTGSAAPAGQATSAILWKNQYAILDGRPRDSITTTTSEGDDGGEDLDFLRVIWRFLRSMPLQKLVTNVGEE
jgi:hypothetical protein